MTNNCFSLPRNAEPLLPSQHRTAFDHWLDANVDSLTGVDQTTADTISDRTIANNVEILDRMEADPTLVTDLLRVRADETLALHPYVLHVVDDQHLDQLLDDLIVAYERNVRVPSGERRPLVPHPGFPEPVLDALNDALGPSYQHPELSISEIGFDSSSDTDDDAQTTLPIKIHDIFSDLRADSIITCVSSPNDQRRGYTDGKEFAARLKKGGVSVRGYAEVSAESTHDKPTVFVGELGEQSWPEIELVDAVWDTAHRHNADSDVRVRKRDAR
jgi:hypothetical protein